LTSDQFQPQSTFARGTSWASAASTWAAVIGTARSVTSASTALTSSGRCPAIDLMPPQASSERRIRQPISRRVAGGIRLASCAQYSTSLRGALFVARSSRLRSYGPRRENSGR
jgi:hypothetical protein